MDKFAFTGGSSTACYCLDKPEQVGAPNCVGFSSLQSDGQAACSAWPQDGARGGARACRRGGGQKRIDRTVCLSKCSWSWNRAFGAENAIERSSLDSRPMLQSCPAATTHSMCGRAPEQMFAPFLTTHAKGQEMRHPQSMQSQASPALAEQNPNRRTRSILPSQSPTKANRYPALRHDLHHIRWDTP